MGSPTADDDAVLRCLRQTDRMIGSESAVDLLRTPLTHQRSEPVHPFGRSRASDPDRERRTPSAILVPDAVLPPDPLDVHDGCGSLEDVVIAQRH